MIDIEKITKSIILDGSRFLLETKKSGISKHLKESNWFKIEIDMVPRYNSLSFAKSSSDVSPPMPLIVGPIAIYDMGPKIKIRLKESDSLFKEVEVNNDLSNINIKISTAFIDNRYKCIIKINDESRLEVSLNSLNHHSNIHLGKGYSKRYWNGIINYIKVFCGNTENSILQNIKLDGSNFGEYFSFDKKIEEEKSKRNINALGNSLSIMDEENIKEDEKHTSILNSCIVIKPIYGLCNRMRVIASFKVLADYLKVPLLVHWDESEGFDDSLFLDLFEPLPNVHFINDYQWMYYRGIGLIIDDYERENLNSKNASSVIEKKQLDELTQSGIITYSGFRELKNFIKTLEISLIKNYTIKVDKYYSKFKPASGLRSIIAKITDSFDSETVGLHIRRGDSVLSPHKDKYLISSDEKFVQLIEELISNNRSVNFFLSTDSKNVQTLLLKKFGNKIKYYKKSFYTSEWKKKKLGQDDAIVDLYCLASTSMIYGTNWSTFSLVSSKINNISLEII